MGFFADLGIDMDNEVEESGFTEPEAGFYAFEISNATVVNGTSKDEDVVKFRVDYALYGDDEVPAGTKSEWWTLFENVDEVTEKAEKSRGYLKGRLRDLGFQGSINDLEPEDIIGVTGTIRLVQNGDYTNVRNVKAHVKEEAPAKAAPARGTRAASTTAKPNPFKKS